MDYPPTCQILSTPSLMPVQVQVADGHAGEAKGVISLPVQPCQLPDVQTGV